MRHVRYSEQTITTGYSPEGKEGYDGEEKTEDGHSDTNDGDDTESERCRNRQWTNALWHRTNVLIQ